MDSANETNMRFKSGILREQVRLAMQQIPTMQTASFIVALVLSWLVRDTVSQAEILAWLLMVFSIALCRIVLYFRFSRVREGPFVGEYWKNAYVILALVSGIIWGLSAFLVFPTANPELISLFLIAMASLSAATTISHSSIKYGPTVWSAPALLLYAIRCLMEGGEFGYTLGFLIILYLLAISRHSLTHHGSITSAIAVRFENLELLEEVQRVNDDLRREITVRKQAEDTLRQSEERLTKAFHASSAPIAITRLVDGYLFDVNESFLHQFGYRREEVIGRMASELVDYAFSGGREGFLQLLRSQGRIHDQEVQLRTNSGDIRQVLISAEVSQIRGEEYILTSFIDITERRQAEEALRESEEKFRSLFALESDAVFLLDRETGQILDVNHAACELYGYTREEMLSLKHTDMSAEPGETERAAREFKERIYLRYHRKKDGTIFPTDISASLLILKDRHIIQAAVRDIGERKRYEDALKASEERFRLLVESAPDAIVVQAQGLFAYVNPAAVKLFGAHSEDELVKTPILERVHPSCRETVQERIRRANVERKPNLPAELRFLALDGRTLEVESRAMPISYENQEGALVFLRDITERRIAEEERRRLEQRLQQVQKAESLGRMAGAIAHNFNNMLGVVIGNLELAHDEAPQGSAMRRFLSEAMNASHRAAEISGFMLTYLGQTMGRTEPIDLSNALREACVLLKTTIPANVHLRESLPSGGPIIQANGAQLTQILNNLISNAVEAIGEREGEITLAIHVVKGGDLGESNLLPLDWEPKAEEHACISIGDTGCGMNAETLEKIFDPFFTTGFTGRGLGLPVVLGLVRMFEGAIAVESQPGKGATFKVYFPISEEEPSGSVVDGDLAGPSVEGGGLVLVVDDEPMLRAIAEVMLKEKLGYEVLTAGDGLEALEIFGARKDEIRLVLLDLSMPGMDGWQVLSALRALRPGVPVIIVSGHDEAQVMCEVLSERPQAFLHKPYGLNDLKAALVAAQRAKLPSL